MPSESARRTGNDRSDAMALGSADAAAGRPNRLTVKDDMTRYQQSSAWKKAYDWGYEWKSRGPGRFVEPYPPGVTEMGYGPTCDFIDTYPPEHHLGRRSEGR